MQEKRNRKSPVKMSGGVMEVKIIEKTLRNEDLIRQNYAIKDFIKQITSVITHH
jgi:hypothetical protein